MEDSIGVNNKWLPTRTIGNKAIIARIRFQTRSNTKPGSNSIHLSDSIEIAEVLYYQDILSNNQLQNIRAYLSAKYSINLSATSPTGNQFSKQTSTLGAQSFTKEILTLGRDTTQDWYQTQTSTTDSDSIIYGFSPYFGLRSFMPAAPVNPGAHLILGLSNQIDSLKNSLLCDSLDAIAPMFRLQKKRWIGTNPTVSFIYSKYDYSRSNNYRFRIIYPDTSYQLLHSYYNNWLRMDVPIASWPPVSSAIIVREPNPDSCNSPVNKHSLTCQTLLDSLMHYPDARIEVFNLEGHFIGSYTIGEFNLSPSAHDYVHVRLTSEERGLHYEGFVRLTDCDQWLSGAEGARLLTEDKSARNTTEPSEQEFVKVFPNPLNTSSLATIELHGFQGQRVKILISDTKGTLLESSQVEASTNLWMIQFRPPSAGVYLIHVNGLNKVYTEQLIAE